MVRVCVVGAGIIGLSCAVNIQKLIPRSEVTIVADKFGNDTTSSGAGGLFRPNVGHIPGVPIDTLKRWSKCSWDHFSALALSSDAAASGNNVTNGFILQDKLEHQFLGELVFTYHKMSQEELDRINSKLRYGYNVTTVITEPKKYLAWLMRQFKENGGRIEVKTLRNLQEVSGQCDVIVNCCGLRADTLVGDTKMKPNRGQLVKLRAPWIRGFYYIEHDGYSTYIVPHAEVVSLGGCRQDGVTGVEVDPAMTEDILRRGRQMIPAIGDAQVIGGWAGIRPIRSPIRLEKEMMKFGRRTLPVFHNYGHGGNGISLSWGTAVETAQLVKQSFESFISKAKL